MFRTLTGNPEKSKRPGGMSRAFAAIVLTTTEPTTITAQKGSTTDEANSGIQASQI